MSGSSSLQAQQEEIKASMEVANINKTNENAKSNFEDNMPTNIVSNERNSIQGIQRYTGAASDISNRFNIPANVRVY